eukprot:365623-Chlamydomonas_euryale.AAC.12
MDGCMALMRPQGMAFHASTRDSFSCVYRRRLFMRSQETRIALTGERGTVTSPRCERSHPLGQNSGHVKR